MKAFFFLLLVLGTFANSSLRTSALQVSSFQVIKEGDLGSLGADIGSNCGNTGSLNMLGLSSSVWPPVKGAVTAMSLYVQVLQNNLNIQELYVTEELNSSSWDHIEYSVNANVNPGVYSINFDFQYPPGSGSYVITIQPSNGQHLGCWGFAYNC